MYTVCGNYWYTAATERRPYDLASPVRPALVFVNTHHVTKSPRPVPANPVDVGGIHLTAPRPLPAVSTSKSLTLGDRILYAQNNILLSLSPIRVFYNQYT